MKICKKWLIVDTHGNILGSCDTKKSAIWHLDTFMKPIGKNLWQDSDEIKFYIEKNTLEYK